MVRRSITLCVLFVHAACNPSFGQTLEIAPSSDVVLTFAGPQGGPLIPRSVTAWRLDNADFRELDFAVFSDQPWLAVAPLRGILPGSLVLNRTMDVAVALNEEQVDRLAPGVYTATVTFVNLLNGFGNSTRTVRLEISPASFTISPTFINVEATVGGSSPPPAVVTLLATGRADLNYSLAWPIRSWFSPDVIGGTVPGNGLDEVLIHFNVFGLAAGTYTASVAVQNVTTGAGNRELPVTLVVRPSAGGAITLSPDQDFVVRGAAGRLPGPTQQSTLANGLSATITWNAEADEDWVSVSPAAGELAPNDRAPGGNDEQAVQIRLNSLRDELPAGPHTATVTFHQTIFNPLLGSTSKVPVGARLVHVTADPVLQASVPLAGGSVHVAPPGRTVAAGLMNELVMGFNDLVTLTAAAGDGFEFRRWEADFRLNSNIENPLVLTMDRSRAVAAIFAPILRTLTLSTSGAGTGTVTVAPTATIIDNSLVSRYNNGSRITVTATPDAGSIFGGWAGNVPVGMELINPLTIVMDRDRTITARFVEAVDLTVTVVGDGQVAVAPQQPGYAVGSVVTLTAHAADGYVFAGWSGSAAGASPTLTLTLNDDLVIVATFVESAGGGGGVQNPNLARLSVDVVGDGVVTPPGGQFAMGATVMLIATPAIGSDFARWEGDVVGNQLTSTIVMNGDRTVRAVFQLADDPAGQPRPGSPSLCGAAGMLGPPLLLLGLIGMGRRPLLRRA